MSDNNTHTSNTEGQQGCSLVTQQYLNTHINHRKEPRHLVKARERAERKNKIKKESLIRTRRDIKFNFNAQSFKVRHEVGLSPDLTTRVDSLFKFMQNFKSGDLKGSTGFNLADTVKTITSTVLGTTFDVVTNFLGEHHEQITIFCLRVSFSLILFTVFAFSNLPMHRKLTLIAAMACILIIFGDQEFVDKLMELKNVLSSNKAQSSGSSGEMLLPLISLIVTTLLTKWSMNGDQRNKNHTWSKLTMDSLLS